MSQILDTSIAVLLWRRFYKWYGAVEERASSIYQDSQTYRLSKGVLEKIKACFRYSFLGRITEIKEPNPALLNNSRAVRYLTDSCKRWKDKIIRYSKSSSTVNLTKDTKEQFVLSPAKIISIIIVTAILANGILSIVLQKQVGLWGWFIRGLFLFVGFAGLFCQADWRTVKESSVLLGKSWIDEGE